MSGPLRLVQVGAGSMGRAWLDTIAGSPDVELVGLADVDVATAREAIENSDGADVPVATSLTELLADLHADAVINVTVPEAHLPVNLEALRAGLPVLCEKPAAPTVAQALVMVAASQAAGELVMISQSRRYWTGLNLLREQVRVLGGISTLVCEFFRDAHYPGFREVMAHPLLVDMSIHHFDQARFITGADPVVVSATTFNPEWSWFSGHAAANVEVEFTDGAHLSYAGSWVTGGIDTSWNGSWRVAGRHGTALWDGDHDPVATYDDDRQPAAATSVAHEIAGSLAEFVTAVRTGAQPDTRIAGNVISLATVEAAVRSADEHRPVRIDEVLDDAYGEACDLLAEPAVRETLLSWDSAREGLSRRPG